MKLLIPLMFVFLSTSAFSITECPVNISKLYVGDGGGILWLSFVKGGAAHVSQNDINFKSILSVSLAAKMADKDIVVRFVESNVTCNSGTRGDVRGIWLK
jgi:hypothetical protein